MVPEDEGQDKDFLMWKEARQRANSVPLEEFPDSIRQQTTASSLRCRIESVLNPDNNPPILLCLTPLSAWGSALLEGKLLKIR